MTVPACLVSLFAAGGFELVGRVTATESADTTSHSHDISGLSIAAGDLLVSLIHQDGASDSFTPTGHTNFVTQVTSTSFRGSYKVCTGSETSVAWTSGASEKACSINYLFRKVGSTTPEAGTVGLNVSGAPDPAALSPSWGSAKVFWIAVAPCDQNGIVTTAPSGYSDLVTTQTTGGTAGSNVGIGAAYRETEASSEDPGAFDDPGAGSKDVTIAIKE